MNLPLGTDFTESHRFGVVVFSFSFVSMYILTSLLISSVICWLFRNVLFGLHMASHSSILAWKIPWMEEPVRLQSMGLQTAGHD